MRLIGVMALCGTLLASEAAVAQVALSNEVFVEDRATGRRKPAATAARGDSLIYVFTYRNQGSQRIINYTINHPLVPTAEYVGEATGAPLMSVDKGVTFGPLETLRVRRPDGTEHVAMPRDVTHLRWRIPTIIEPGASGQVRYRARLR